jgi:cytochrome d ubiquinol oxidase subunit II
MDLRVVWFVLVSVLFTGFFFLEGFDYGVGILLPFLGKDDHQRRQVINAIGPFWDANEVWLLVAGGAMFAAFPNWYATLFSGLYLALFLMLVALIVRAVGFEFRSKDQNPRWRRIWDWAIFGGSLIPALLWGVALANLLRGLKIDATMTHVGSFWDLLNPYGLVGGLATVALFTLHGALFLNLKTGGEIESRAQGVARWFWIPAGVLAVLFLVGGFWITDMAERLGLGYVILPLAAGISVLAAGWSVRKQRAGWAFVLSGVGIVLAVATIFVGLYPRLVPSTLNPAWSLTIYNSASGDYTLRVMTIVAAIFVPVVLLYQAWSYRIFRHRVSHETKLEY